MTKAKLVNKRYGTVRLLRLFSGGWIGRVLVSIIGLILLAADPAFAQKKYSAVKLANMEGHSAAVVGKIYQIVKSRKGIIFIYIGGKYPHNSYTGVIYAKDARNFKDVYKYRQKTVEINGEAHTYHGTLELILNAPEEIRIAK
ncbi:MAG: hypothetical protein WAO19_11050 [Candidatus Kryptoniota bacterium]